MTTLTSHKLLCFDVYATLIDWETGLNKALEPLVSRIKTDSPSTDTSKTRVLTVIDELENQVFKEHPRMLYRDILALCHARLAAALGSPATKTTQAEDTAFGASVGSWPAFPDTVTALQRLAKHYKLVVLSNVDHESFAGTLSGPLQGFKFDAVLTAQDIGSYKPAARNFEVMLAEMKTKFGVDKEDVLITAQSMAFDLIPGHQLGIKGAWIERPGSLKPCPPEDEQRFNFRFDTLGDMADAVEAEAGAGKK